MSQNSLVLPNTSTATFRSNANNALDTLVTLNSGTAAPSTTSAYMLWADTTNALLKIRNSANSGWIVLGPINGSWLSEGAALASASTLTLGTDGAIFHVTGTTTITALSGNQSLVTLVFDGSLVLTHGSTLLLRDSANVTTRANCVFGFVNDGGGVWREVFRTLSGEITTLGIVPQLTTGLVFV